MSNAADEDVSYEAPDASNELNSRGAVLSFAEALISKEDLAKAVPVIGLTVWYTEAEGKPAYFLVGRALLEHHEMLRVAGFLGMAINPVVLQGYNIPKEHADASH